MSEFYDPQRIARILHLAMEETLGREELRGILESARLPAQGAGYVAEGPESAEAGRFALTHLTHMLATLEQIYGAPAGRGLALRIGRACFQYGVREYGEPLGLTSTSFRLLPLPAKLVTFAGALAGLFNSPTDHSVHVEEGQGKLRWHIERCPFCQQRHADEPICMLPVGLAEESLYWLSGGKMFAVQEVACIARGDPACIVEVDETPLS
jgi:predicted hydrocarbon binding protein